MEMASNPNVPVLIRIVYFGDSITAGQYVDPALRWTTLIDHKLECYMRNDALLHAINRGVSGDTTRTALERYPADVQNLFPDILTIQFGMNDCNCWLTDRGMPRVSPLAFRANLLEMVARARAFGVRHILFVNSHITLRNKVMLNGHHYEAANAEYSDVLEDVAHYTDCWLCDVRRPFKEFDSTQLESLLLPYPDQLHLSPAGHRTYAEILCESVKQACYDVLREKRKQ